MEKQEYLGIEIGLLANMGFALNMTDEKITAPDYMNLIAHTDEIVDKLPENERDAIRAAFILTADASKLLTMLLFENTPEQWAEKVKKFVK